MIYDHISNWTRYPEFQKNAVWRTAFEWLQKQAATSAEGIFDLGQRDFIAKVMAYSLKSRNEARMEMHRKTIDIQYTILGAEGIETATTAVLKPCNDYSAEQEVEFFLTPDLTLGRLDNHQGYFTVLFAGEPHMPQLQVPGFKEVRKAVIKVPVVLVA